MLFYHQFGRITERRKRDCCAFFWFYFIRIAWGCLGLDYATWWSCGEWYVRWVQIVSIYYVAQAMLVFFCFLLRCNVYPLMLACYVWEWFWCLLGWMTFGTDMYPNCHLDSYYIGYAMIGFQTMMFIGIFILCHKQNRGSMEPVLEQLSVQ